MSILAVLIDLAHTYISDKAKHGETKRVPKKEGLLLKRPANVN